MILAVGLATVICGAPAWLGHLRATAVPGELATAHARSPLARVLQRDARRQAGLKTEDGAGAFSLIKHTLLVLLGIFYFAWFADAEPWHAAVFWQAALAVWLTMIAVAYALPQFLYRRTTAQWLGPLVPLLRALAWTARPFVALLEFFQSLLDLADDAAAAEEAPTSAENIEALIFGRHRRGLIEEEDRELIQSVVEFGDKVVREVMTPRPNIVAILADATLEQLREMVINEQYSRIPVYERDIDHVAGFVHVRDMFEVERGRARAPQGARTGAQPHPRPRNQAVSDLMRQMQRENTHMVIVVDEYGNTAGLATMEDLLEVIIGEIRDEHEPDSDVTKDGHGGYVVSGSFDLDRVGDLFPSFHREEDIESTTVGGMVSEWLGRVPKAGEVVDRKGIRVEVLASDDLRVGQVRIGKSQEVAHE